MTKLIILIALGALINAEAPLPAPYGRIALTLPRSGGQSEDSKIVDQSLLDRVADILSQGGDGSEGNSQEQQDERSNNNNIVNSELFERIARIISQNEGQLQAQTQLESNPQPKITSDYGVPKEEVEKLIGGNIQLGMIERARRIASFDLSSFDNSIGGGYRSTPAQFQQNANGNNFARLMFISEPQVAESIAAFDIPENTNSAQQQQRESYRAY